MSKRSKFAAAFLSLLVFSTGFCFAQSEDDIDERFQENLYIVEPVREHILDPHLSSYSSDAQILSGLYEGLFSYNPVTLLPQPAIATNYRISRDKKRWTITLREDAKFSNGEQITAESVRWSWLQLLANQNAPYASLLDIIRGAKEFRQGQCNAADVGIYATAPDTLTVYLEQPANYLAKILCCSSFSIINKNPSVYSGPYKLTELNRDSYVIEKNPYYWDADNTKIKRITFLQSNNSEENTFLFNTGAVDWVTSEINAEKVINKNSMQVNAEFGTTYFFFKLSNKKTMPDEGRRESVWDYQEFRSALMEIFPWDQMRAGGIMPSSTLVFPLTGYPQVEGYSYSDEIEAKRLMKLAREKYGYAEDEIIPLVFEIPEASLPDEKLTYFSDALMKIGVELQIRVMPSYAYFSHVTISDADLFTYTWIGDFADPYAFLSLFQSDSTLNDSGYNNPEFDELLKKAAEVGDQERYKLLAQAETILLDSAMIFPLYHPVAFNVINLDDIGGWATNAFDLHYLKYLFKKVRKVSVPNVVMK